MDRRAVLWYIGTPVLAAAGYGLFVALLPPREHPGLYTSEGNELYNPAEWGAALLFAATGAAGFMLAAKTRKHLPAHWVCFYALFGLMGILMAGEELSWGQHIFNFETPGFFREHNKQRELNLHNLSGDRPSSLLRKGAEIGFPVLLVILPALHLWLDKKAYTPGHWPYYVLPRFEAMAAVILGNLCRPIDKTEGWGVFQVDELAELFWAMATLFWALALLRRHSRPQPPLEAQPA